MKLDIAAVITAAMTVIGFLSIWVKMGFEKGEQKKSMELLEQKTGKHDSEIAELKNAAHSTQLDIARSMGKIEAKLDSIGKIESKLDSISETVAALKGGRHAPEK